MAVAAGADALGFIFAPSPRRIELPEAAEIIAQLPNGIEKIGVFVNETPAHVAEWRSRWAFPACSCTATKSSEQMPEFRQALGERKIIKTLQAREILHAGEEQLAECLSARGSIDAHPARFRFGTASAAEREFPSRGKKLRHWRLRFGRRCR